jgi:hypothetical protein
VNIAKEVLLHYIPFSCRVDELKIKLPNKRGDDLAHLHKAVLADASARTHPELRGDPLAANIFFLARDIWDLQ